MSLTRMASAPAQKGDRTSRRRAGAPAKSRRTRSAGSPGFPMHYGLGDPALRAPSSGPPDTAERALAWLFETGGEPASAQVKDPATVGPTVLQLREKVPRRGG